MADETNPTAPGGTTSEGKLTKVAFAVGLVLESAAGVLHSLQDAGQVAPWFPTVLAVIGVLLQIATFFGYTKSRTLLKSQIIASDAVAAQNPKQP
jgi:hypothetical protein